MSAKADFKVNLPERDLNKLIAMMRETAKATGMAEDQFENLEREIRSGSRGSANEVDKLNKKFDGFGGTVKKVGGFLVTAFAVDQLIEYQKKIIDVTAEFEKMEAVLTTALGSNSAAQVAMAQIQNFASKTPFQVGQLTDSYVKLVNRGLQPTNKALTALGDFSAAAGKDIDQLVEAILDVNNTERWTELGLKVKTEGDRIKATFKGITVEADRTEAGAMDMVKAFGEMEGVAGSMAGISETLGGKISNLEDSFERLFNTIGQAESGPMQTVIEWLSDVLNLTSDLLENDLAEINREAAKMFDEMRGEFEDLESIEDFEKKIDELTQKNRELADEYNNLNEEQIQYENSVERLEKKLIRNDSAITEFNGKVEELGEKMKDTKVEFKANDVAITFLNSRLEMLKKQLDQNNDSWDDFIISLTDSESAAMRLSVQMEKLARDAFEAMKDSGEDWISEMEAFILEGADAISDADQKIVDSNAEMVDQYKQNLNDLKEYMQGDFYADMLNIGSQYVGAISQIQINAHQQQLQRLQQQKEFELQLAGDNKDERAKIEEEYDRKEATIRARQAERERQAALFEIAIRSAQNLVEAFPNPLLMAAAAGLGIAQAAVVLSEPVPAFRDGVVDFKGRGSETSDDNLVKISNRESIMTALSTKRFRRYLEAMNEPSFTEKDLQKMVLKQLPEGVTMPGSGTVQLDDKRIIKSIDELRKDVRSKETVRISLNGHTYTAEMIDGLNKKKYLSKKFGIKL